MIEQRNGSPARSIIRQVNGAMFGAFGNRARPHSRSSSITT
jgi:hypothetical protein